jgi:hypothetical protein
MTCDRILDEKMPRLLDERILEDVIDRSKCEIPDTFVPSAKLIALGNDLTLYLANPLTTFSGRKPRSWRGSVETGVFRTISLSYFLKVRRYGTLWSIERHHLDDWKQEVLAFNYGPTPIFYREQQPAMALAKDCLPKPREEVQCMSWVPIAA